MPTLKAQELNFIRKWMRANRDLGRMPTIERQCKLKKGQGERWLRRKAIAEEIDRQLKVEADKQVALEKELERQWAINDLKNSDLEKQVLTLERDKEMLRDELSRMKSLPRQKITEEMVQHELVRLNLLNPETHGKIKLESLMVSAVILGLARRSSFERALPPIPPDAEQASIYESVFSRQRGEQMLTVGESEAVNPIPAAPAPEPEEDAAPLMPEPVVRVKAPPRPRKAAPGADDVIVVTVD